MSHLIAFPARLVHHPWRATDHKVGDNLVLMSIEQQSYPPVVEEHPNQMAVADELTRVKIFLGIQAFFLVVSVFTGGFNFKLWSMLDTALMIQSIGVTALVVVLEDVRHRRLAFKVAILLYLLAVLDMGINVCVSGVVGWKTTGA